MINLTWFIPAYIGGALLWLLFGIVDDDTINQNLEYFFCGIILFFLCVILTLFMICYLNRRLRNARKKCTALSNQIV